MARSAALSTTIDGVRDAFPLALAAIPFGLVYGVAVVDSSLSSWVGASASWLLLAGAAQISMLGLMNADAAWPIAVGTALVINARFALYSAALAPAFSQFPRRWRWTLPYLLTDQAATLSIARFQRVSDPVLRRVYYLACGLWIAVMWWAGSISGVLLGASIPDQVEIGFIVPAVFLALLVPTLTDRPAVVAAVIGAAVTAAGASLPNGLNIFLGAIAGVAAGRISMGRLPPARTDMAGQP